MVHKTADRVVCQTEHNECEVSTVFLGLDHQYGSGPPLLFETLVFGGDQDGLMERCSTWDEAEKQHNRVMETVKGNFNMGNERVTDNKTNYLDRLIYRLFVWRWNPILRKRPDLREFFISWLKAYDTLDEGDRIRVEIARVKE